jgi:hypothetical protein
MGLGRAYLSTNYHFRLPAISAQTNGCHHGALQAENPLEVKDAGQIYGMAKCLNGWSRSSVEQNGLFVAENVVYPFQATEAQDEVKVKKSDPATEY